MCIYIALFKLGDHQTNQTTQDTSGPIAPTNRQYQVTLSLTRCSTFEVPWLVIGPDIWRSLVESACQANDQCPLPKTNCPSLGNSTANFLVNLACLSSYKGPESTQQGRKYSCYNAKAIKSMNNLWEISFCFFMPFNVSNLSELDTVANAKNISAQYHLAT